MTLSNHERANRCQRAISSYSNDDPITNFVDFLADAMHWYEIEGRSFSDALETAAMHFDAELHGDDILESFKNGTATERNKP